MQSVPLPVPQKKTNTGSNPRTQLSTRTHTHTHTHTLHTTHYTPFEHHKLSIVRHILYTYSRAGCFWNFLSYLTILETHIH
ncbi:hypothetical protein G9A89_002227 [Geosiphon pyriformis]|nr:hypothetical protein G9A89_002227 [Geosiphon pyriformis]